MSISPTAPPVAPATGPAPAMAPAMGQRTGPRRVRQQARDVVALMVFSAATSTALAAGLMLLAHLPHAAGR